jgi:hypothetical protein
MSFVLGIDVAKYQGDLVFQHIVNARPVDINGKIALNLPVSYVDIKACHGANGLDPKFIRNAEKSAGIIRRGFYGWFVPAQDPIQQADYLVDNIKPFALKNDLLTWVDFEQYDSNFRGEVLRERFRTYVDQIEDRTGRPVVVYTGKYYWQLACLDQDDEWIAGHYFAHAEYPGVIPGEDQHGHVAKPWAIRNIMENFHQFDGDKGLYLPADCGNTGSIIDCDFDRFNGTEAELEEMCQLTFSVTRNFDIYKPVEIPSREQVLEELFPSQDSKKENNS